MELTQSSLGAHRHHLELTQVSLGAHAGIPWSCIRIPTVPFSGGPTAWAQPVAAPPALSILPGGGDCGGPDPAGQPSGCAVELKRHLAAWLRGRRLGCLNPLQSQAGVSLGARVRLPLPVPPKGKGRVEVFMRLGTRQALRLRGACQRREWGRLVPSPRPLGHLVAGEGWGVQGRDRDEAAFGCLLFIPCLLLEHLLYARLHSWRRRPSKVSICILLEETRSAEQAQEQRRSFQRERSPVTETHRGVRELHRSERASLKR